MKNTQPKRTRREFIKTSTISATAFTIIPRFVLGGKGFIAPIDKLNIACLGIGGKGRVDVQEVSSENIIALCDVDQARAGENRGNMKNAYDAFPGARHYQDFREMFDKEKDIDAVTISTPDHTHAVITMEAMKKGLHVYTQKPITRTVDESRKNSGVFFRTTDIDNPVQTGIEVQIRDDYGKTPIDKNFCGSIYDIKEVSENRVKKPGKWNQLKMICDGSFVEVYLNNKKVIDIDLSDWEEAGKNPDGTKNKFNTAYKDMARKGKIGFQDHGGKVWFRNLKIQKL